MSASTLQSELQAIRNGFPEVLAQWAAAEDDITRRIVAIARSNPFDLLPPGTSPESGTPVYASLRYDTLADGARAFEEHSPYIYGRVGNPLQTKLVEILKLFDPKAAEGAITSTGMAAVNASLDVLSGPKLDEEASVGLTAGRHGVYRKGDHIVASKFAFGTCRLAIEHLQKYGVEVTFIDGTNLKEWENAIRPNTKMFWFESPGNPTMEVVDIAAVAKIAHSNGRDIVVTADNSLAFAGQQPLTQGADIAVSSITKALGYGEDLGGVILMSQEGIDRVKRVTNKPDVNAVLYHRVRNGTMLSPRVIELMIERAITLKHRFAHQAENGYQLANYIQEKHPDIRVIHPFVGNGPQVATARSQMAGTGVFSIVFNDPQKAELFTDTLIGLGVPEVNNFGGLETSVTHPGSTTHASLTREQQEAVGITPSLVRISTGIEPPEFVLKVVGHALEVVKTRFGQPTPATADHKQKPVL